MRFEIKTNFGFEKKQKERLQKYGLEFERMKHISKRWYLYPKEGQVVYMDCDMLVDFAKDVAPYYIVVEPTSMIRIEAERR